MLADVAYRHGVMLIAGPRLSPDGALDRYLRIPYSLPAATLESAVHRIGVAWEELRTADAADLVFQVV
jgi:hypothetical protein